MKEELWYTADWDLYLKLVGQGDFVYEQRPSTAFRIHASSLTINGSQDTDDFNLQMAKVLNRHFERVQSRHAPTIMKLARASIAINTALAAGINGSARKLLPALSHILKMWPSQLIKYIEYSRIFDRVLPRVRILAHLKSSD